MSYLIGIDGGGTQTIGVIADTNGNHLSKVVGKSTNYHVVGIEQVEATLGSILKQLLQNIGIRATNCQAACFGLAGVGRAEDHQKIYRLCERIGIPRQFILTHDAEIALTAGIRSGIGVLAISGTGSMVYGQNSEGKSVRVGGWGHLLGDEGSGYDIGHRGLKAITQMSDGRRQPTTLRKFILAQISLDRVDQLVRWVSMASKSQISALAISVFESAETGDKVAQAIIEQAGKALVIAIRTAIRRLELSTNSEVFLSGGVFQNQPSFVRFLQEQFPEKTIQLIRQEPVCGAIRIAQRLTR